jgi:prevent-host-death family protein
MRPSEDVRSLSEFRANASTFIQQVQGTGRPMILTVHGRSAAVLVDAVEYDAMLDQLDLLRDVRTAEGQLTKGSGVTHASAKSKTLGRLRR